jgi:hypothetical protein
VVKVTEENMADVGGVSVTSINPYPANVENMVSF